jgi:L-threonylcarbamoyladenylate synthase
MKIYTQNQIEETVEALKNHNSVALPTDTVYGLAVLYGDLKDLQHLKVLKDRDANKPIPFMVNTVEMMETIAQVDERTKKIVDTFLPGALTLVLPVLPSLDRTYTNGKDTIAIRIPDEPFILQVIEKLKTPLLVSSANQSGQPAALSVEQVQEQLPNVDVIVSGQCARQQASTIVDCTKEELVILREGPISLEELNRSLKK